MAHQEGFVFDPALLVGVNPKDCCVRDPDSPPEARSLPITCAGGQDALWKIILEESFDPEGGEEVPVSQSYFVPGGPYRSFADSLGYKEGQLPDRIIALLSLLAMGIKADKVTDRVLESLTSSKGDVVTFFGSRNGVDLAQGVEAVRSVMVKQKVL